MNDYRRPVLLLAAALATALLVRPALLDAAHARSIAAALVTLLWLAFCIATWARHRNKVRRAEAAMRGEFDATSDATSGAMSGATLVAFASQTGYAEQLASQTAEALRAAGNPVCIVPLSHVDSAMLAAVNRALFIVSTTGEGDAPDNAASFVRNIMPHTVALQQLEYGLLALGDRSYTHFCGFGHALDHWLRHQHASPLFDPVEVDNGDTGALRHWQHQLGVLTGSTNMADWSTPSYGRWRLAERHLLNPGSPGGPAFHLALTLPDDEPTWEAGDIAEIGPCNPPHAVAQAIATLGVDAEARVKHDSDSDTLRLADLLLRSRLPSTDADWSALRGLTPQALADMLEPLPHREYSIASLPADGRLELLVRQMHHPDGTPGLGSGWLTEYAQPDAEIALRIRTNRAFHAPPDHRPLILIGNGTGLAGLRAHLKARAVAGHHRNWLLFGERTSAHDRFFDTELQAWQRTGVLQHLDLTFSRDSAAHRYVQDRLHIAADELRAWVADGAAIYVCGSLQGMASGVARVLNDVLGPEQLEQLADDGRYRRDVY